VSVLYVGCAIWAYEGWIGSFYPHGLSKQALLSAYAERLTTVEVNSTFYALPSLPIVQRWAQQTPESFRFCPKFPRAITHTAHLRAVAAQTDVFLGTMRALGKRLGPLMLQLPPSFSPSALPILAEYLSALPRDLQIAVEVRHRAWFSPEHSAQLDALLAEHGAARVAFDSRPIYASAAPEALLGQEKKPDVPLYAEATQPFALVRYIGSPIPDENAPYLAFWAARISAWLSEQRIVYFFAHCPREENSPGLARALYERVNALHTLPSLPWAALDQPTADRTQLTLF
jgi:uncharacterized protein YecE (DUF72 family)